MKFQLISFTFLIISSSYDAHGAAAQAPAKLALPAISPSTAQSEEISHCIQKIKTLWIKHSPNTYNGNGRKDTACALQMAVANEAFSLNANSEASSQIAPLHISFNFGASTKNLKSTLQTCHIEKEQIRLIFEQKTTGDLERRERYEMRLIKTIHPTEKSSPAGQLDSSKLTLILNKKEIRLLRTFQQESLICHLQ